MNENALFALIPAPAQEALRRAVDAQARNAAGDTKAWEEARNEVDKALQAVGISMVAGYPYPLASVYSEVQRAVLSWSAIHDLTPHALAGPLASKTRRRWIGIDPPGILETHHVEIEHDGTKTKEPLWRALQIAREPKAQEAILDALPPIDTLRAMGEIHDVGFGYRINIGLGLKVLADLRLSDLGDEGRAWAIERANAFPTEPHYAGSYLKAYIFVALARAGVPIEPRWEHLYPNVMGASRELLVECARALPEGRRGEALKKHFPSMRCAVDLVAEFPTADMVQGLLDSHEPNSQRWTWMVEQMRELGKTHPEVLAATEAIVAATPKPMNLYVTRIVKPSAASELTDLEQQQLRIGGKGYDEQDLSADERLAASDSEASFRGFFEVRSIVDEEGEPAFDVMLYGVDSGSIFRAGTTEEIGGIAQGGVALREKNDVLRIALQVAVGRQPLKKKPRAAKKAKKATGK